MTANNQQRPIPIAGFSAFFAQEQIFGAREMDGWNLRNLVP
jgi:hypothetical protein